MTQLPFDVSSEDLLERILASLDDDKAEVVFEGLVEEVAGMTRHALREEKDVAQSVVIFNEKKEAFTFT